MKDIPTSAPPPRLEHRDPRSGLLPAAAQFVIDVASRGQITTISVLQDARTELRSFVDGGLDFADKATTTWLRFLRKLAQRADDALAETFGEALRLSVTAAASARAATHVATDLGRTLIDVPNERVASA